MPYDNENKKEPKNEEMVLLSSKQPASPTPLKSPVSQPSSVEAPTTLDAEKTKQVSSDKKLAPVSQEGEAPFPANKAIKKPANVGFPTKKDSQEDFAKEEQDREKTEEEKANSGPQVIEKSEQDTESQTQDKIKPQSQPHSIANTRPQHQTQAKSPASNLEFSISGSKESSGRESRPLQNKNIIKELLQKAKTKIKRRRENKLVKILEALEEKGKLSNKEIRKIVRKSRWTIKRYMDILEKRNKVEQVGKIGRSVYYRLLKQ